MVLPTIKKVFEIETSVGVMLRIERFLAMLHHNSNSGHSGLFAMPLDGDGNEKVKIIPRPKFAQEVYMIAGVGKHVEIAYDDAYTCKNLAREEKSYWIVKPSITLYKDGEPQKTRHKE